MAGFNPGDVFIDNVSIISPRANSWNMKDNFLSASVVETIFTPGVTAEIEVIDYQDYLGKMKLAGDELVNFQFTKPNGATAKYQFHLNNIKFVEIHGAMKSKVFKLICVSREALHGQANYVQKAYNTQISGIVTDIFQNFLKTNLAHKIEETKGMRNIKVSNQPAFHILETLRKEAVSNKNKSSNFMFFLSQSGIHFRTLEEMIQDSVAKTFKQDNTVGHSMFADVDHNILAWQVIQNFDAMNRIKNGALTQRVATFNSHTNEYIRGDFKPKLSDFVNLGTGLLITEAFKALFPQANRTLIRYINPHEKLKIGKSHFPDNVAYKMTNLAQMQEQLMVMSVLGDPVLEAGKLIDANVPKIQAQSDGSAEAQVSGKWLISKLEHHIARPDTKPRYLCNMECLKGAYQESV